MPNKMRKQIGRAHSKNGVYILDFSIPDCSDGRPWVPHHPHPRELALHDPDPDGTCRDCHTPTASTSAIAGRGLAAIAEAEREAPHEEGLSHLELETATRVAFGTEEHPLPRPESQHLRGMLRGIGVGTFDAHGFPRPFTKEKFLEIYSHQRDSTTKLTMAQEEELAQREAQELRQWSHAAHSSGADGVKKRVPPMKRGGEALADGARATLADGETQLAATLADGEQQLAATPVDGAPPLAARQADGALPAKAGELPARTKGGKKRKSRQNLQEFLALMLTTENGDEEEEAAVAAPVSEEDPEAVYARYMRSSGFRADNALWHQRLGHPSRVMLKNCIEAGVFAPGALLRPDGTGLRGVTHPRNCTAFPEAALNHKPFPLLEPGTNRYTKQEKVYSEFLNMGHCEINDELYTLTFVDAKTRYVWIVNVEARTRAYEHYVSLPYTHQQQGIAKRTNRTLMTKVRALMKQSKLPPIYWTYAMHHAVRVHNLLSTTAITGNLSPHVKWARTKGDTSMLRVWGCMVHYRPPTSTIGKFASRARWGIHFDISHEHKAWLILDLMSQKVINARDVIFDERLFLRQFREDEQANANREVILQHRHDNTVSGLQLLGLHTATSTAPRVIEPKNPRQSLTGPHSTEWREAMDAEIKAIESRDTWVLVDRAAIKARSVVREYDQRHDFDFDQTFALVSRHTSVRILLAIAVAQHLPLRQIDVNNAFLYALVDAYVEQPHTYGEGDSRVCQLRKSLYGIKQAPRLWQQYLQNILLEIGFKQLPHDSGMYRLREKYRRARRQHLQPRMKQILGLNISYSPEAIHLSAAKYAEELGKHFNIAPVPLSTPYRTPGPNHKPGNKALSPTELQTYQQQLGCLLFASVTCRPDLSYIAS
ncbi:unnamed protein product [Closterium sp. NIES-54]